MGLRPNGQYKYFTIVCGIVYDIFYDIVYDIVYRV